MDKIQRKLNSIGDAIREKTGKTELLSLDEMPVEIAAIETGIDTSDATATADNILENETAYVNGEKITGTMLNRNIVGKNGAVGINDNYPNIASNPATNAIPQIHTNLDGVKRLSIRPDTGFYDGHSYVSIPASDLGTANTNQVLSGATFTSSNGLKITGNMPSKATTTITPSTSQQTAITAGTYASGDITVAAMPTATQATPTISVGSDGKITASATQTAGYVSAGTKSSTKQLTTKAASTITPKTTNQTIAAGTYLTGTQTIAGDADLVAGNIKKGVNIFGVDGTYTDLNFNVVGGIGRPYSLVDYNNFTDVAAHTTSTILSNGITLKSTQGAWQGVTYGNKFPVSVGEIWNFTADVDSGYTTSYIQMGIRAYDSNGSVLNDNKLVKGAYPSSNKISFSYTVPSGTAYLSLLILISDGGSSTHGTATLRNIKAGVAANVASENTIWISTSTAISSWAFSSTEPTNPTSGMVCIHTGASSSTEFNALKTNKIQVYPVSAKQYINNIWVSKTIQVYLNGKWNDVKAVADFSYDGTYIIVNDTEEDWEIHLQTSGTFRFNNLNSASKGIEVFLVGGGGNGAKGSDSGQGGGGGGGGGYTTTTTLVPVQGFDYPIVIGGSAGATSGFGATANAGANGTQPGYMNLNGGPGGAGTGKGGDGATGAGGKGGDGEDGVYAFGGTSGTRYGGGGGGSAGSQSTGGGGKGGASGGGAGGTSRGSAGVANTGGGGGGGYSFGSNGGSGIIIIRNKRG